jgi:hypothetical protein
LHLLVLHSSREISAISFIAKPARSAVFLVRARRDQRLSDFSSFSVASVVVGRFCLSETQRVAACTSINPGLSAAAPVSVPFAASNIASLRSINWRPLALATN